MAIFLNYYLKFNLKTKIETKRLSIRHLTINICSVGSIFNQVLIATFSRA